jgi:hypothetical protein
VRHYDQRCHHLRQRRRREGGARGGGGGGGGRRRRRALAPAPRPAAGQLLPRAVGPVVQVCRARLEQLGALVDVDAGEQRAQQAQVPARARRAAVAAGAFLGRRFDGENI